jgi:hypothetical protein
MGREATVHGFRSSFRTWGQDKTEIAREVLKYCLHHIEGSTGEMAYARGDCWDKRKAALMAWELFCNSKPADHSLARAGMSRRGWRGECGEGRDDPGAAQTAAR